MEKKITCSNCGFIYDEAYQFCPSCGQSKKPSLINFKTLLLDTLSAFFSFDTKAIRSIPALLFRPGFLTNQYLKGRRESYLAPFRMYLFISIVLFFALSIILKDREMIGLNGADTRELAEVLDSLGVSENPALTDSLKADTSSRGETQKEEVRLGPLTLEVEKGEEDQQFSFLGVVADNWLEIDSFLQAGGNYEEALEIYFPDVGFFRKVIIRQLLKLEQNRGKGIVQLMIDKVSLAMFIFLPLFALMLKLLYLRRKRYYVEHLVFSLHFFSFFFLVLLILVLLNLLPVKFSFNWILWFPYIYLFFAMKRVYLQSYGRTLAKYGILLFATFGLFIPFLALVTVAISLLLY